MQPPIPGLGQPWTTDLFVPVYQPMRAQDWRVDVVPLSLSRGYFSGPTPVQNMAMLSRNGEQGVAGAWMSMTPLEIESQEVGVRASAGHVLVLGLGMGWAALTAALRPEVTAVTVVEFDPAVIGLFEAQGLRAQVPAEVARKLTILQGDAHSFVPDRPVDTLMADIWLPLYARGRVAEVQRMAANSGAARVYYFGQEIEIAMYAKDAGLPLDAAGIAHVVADMGLPLIGPERPDYPTLVTRAANQWWRGD